MMSLRIIPLTFRFVASLDGVRDRDAAERLRGQKLHVARAVLPELEEEDSYYHADLIGIHAFTPEGERIGEIVAVQNFGAGDLLEIRGEKTSRTELIPFTKSAVPVIDIKGRRVIVDQAEDEDDAGEE